MRKVFWTKEGEPQGMTVSRLIYDLRRDDGDGLLLDSVTEADILEDMDVVLFDALITPYSMLERKMQIMQKVLDRSSAELNVVGMQVTKPFKQNGTVNVAAIFELSDGQTISIYLHNPDTTPSKLAPKDELISWKWLLNKKDVTIVVAPESGKDINVHEVGRRLMKLASANSGKFKKANAKRAEKIKEIEDTTKAITASETELSALQKELEELKAENEDLEFKIGEAKTTLKTLGAQNGGSAVGGTNGPEVAEKIRKANKTADEAIREANEKANRTGGSSAGGKRDSQLERDKNSLRKIINGQVEDILSLEVADSLIGIAERNESSEDQEIHELINQAMNIFEAANTSASVSANF